MQFRLFGVPVEVRLGFWLMAAALGMLRGLLALEQKGTIVVWVAVVFVSIMVHELGHTLAIMRHGIRPAIVLHLMGGMTTWHGAARLRRIDRIIISFAGPLGGFLLAAVSYAINGAVDPAPGTYLDYLFAFLLEVNILWSIFNLLPVMPLDGGNILDEAFGPDRERLSAIVSMSVAVGLTVLAVALRYHLVTFILAMAAFHSYQRFQASSPGVSRRARREREAARRDDEQISQEITAQLLTAKAAIEQEAYEKAGTIAEGLLSTGDLPPSARVEALHVLAWAHLLPGRTEEAVRIVQAIEQIGEADLALVGWVLHQRGDGSGAREVLELARAGGDNRKEVVGPLIQILISQGDVERAAAIALDIVDTLSDDDARQMAKIAFDAGVYVWAARLSETMFNRSGLADDAYDAARGRALEGDHSAALALLRRAVAAGFSDAARAWSDAALEQIRSSAEAVAELEAVLPRPTGAGS